MIEFKPLPQATVTPGVPALLQDSFYVRFSDHWPASLAHIAKSDPTSPTGVRGKFFQIGPVNQVPYDISYIIPSGDFRDVDFSNVGSNFNENLYPASNRTLYEIQLGWKPANMLAHFFIPAGEFVSRLEQANMAPNVTSATLRYLGARKPEDSPYNDRRIFIYTVFNMEPFIIRQFVDSGLSYYAAGVYTNGFEKVTMGLTVNKCYLTEIPNPTPQQYDRAKLLRYYTEVRWNQ